VVEITFKSISPTFILNPNLTKQIPLNPDHQDLSNNTKRPHFNNSSQIFSEEIIQYSRTFALQVQTSWNQAHAPLLIVKRALQRHQEHDLKHPSSVDLIPTKQNKLPLLHRKTIHQI